MAVNFSNDNTAASPTLNVNSTGAKAIKRYGQNVPGQEGILSGVHILVYDGTAYQLVNPNPLAGLGLAWNGWALKMEVPHFMSSSTSTLPSSGEIMWYYGS